MNFLIVCIEATLLELVWFVFRGTGFKLKTFLFPGFFILSFFAFLLYVFKDISSVDGLACSCA